MNEDEALIKKFETDPVSFIEVFLERELTKKQKEFLEKTRTRNHILAIWSRQTGKSTVIASYIVWRLLYGKGCTVQGEHMNEKIAICAPIKEQLNNLYDKIRTLVDKSEFISQYIEKINTERIVVKNGNRANFFSASPGSHIRGYTATCIVIDESQDITDNKYSADILPFGATTNALIIEAGTPKTKNHFFAVLNSKSVEVVRQPWFECPFLSEEYVMQQKEISPDGLWRQEYLCEFVEEGVLAFPSRLFEPETNKTTGALTGRWNLGEYTWISKLGDLTQEVVKKVNESHEEGASYVAGLDLGKVRDYSIYCIWRDDERPIKLQVMLKFELGTEYTEIARAIAMFHTVYAPREFNLDYSNEKSFVEILRNTDVPVIIDPKKRRGAIHFTNQNKAEMITTGVVLLEKFQLQVPKEHELLIREFMNQQFEVQENTQIRKFFHPSNEHDDMLWSTLLALKNITLFSPKDIVGFVNPWEKHNEDTHGFTRKDIKEVLSVNKKERKFRRSQYLRADMRRNQRVGLR